MMSDNLNHGQNSEGQEGGGSVKKSIFRQWYDSRFPIPKGRIIALLAAGFLAGLTICVFTPLEIYLHNINDFMISLRSFAAPLFPIFLFLSAILIAFVLMMHLLFGVKFFEFFTLSGFGCTLAFYIQGLLLNGEMSQLTGDRTNYSALTFPHFLNFFIFALITFAPVIILAILRKRKKDKPVRWEKAVIWGALLVFGMQASGFISSLPLASAIERTSLDPPYFSYDEAFALSKNKNICVFILDRLDGSYMDETLASYPELYDMLDGFTYYRNNTSFSTHTFPSVPQMLTGFSYDGKDKWDTYWEKAWAGDYFLDRLKEAGYKNHLLLDQVTVLGDLAQVEKRADNIRRANASDLDINREEIIKASLTLSIVKIFPYFGKDYFVPKIDSDFSNKFLIWNTEDAMLPAVGYTSDSRFDKRLRDVGLSAPHEENVFSIAHFNCAHTADYVTMTYTSLKTLDEYFRQMKELGIYDDSVIILLGDHGRTPSLLKIEDNIIAEPILTSLIIKPAGSRGMLQTDDDSELSNEFFASSILDYAGAERDGYGYSYKDIIDNRLSVKRTLYYNTWRGYGDVTPRGYYVIEGDASNFDNWTYVPY